MTAFVFYVTPYHNVFSPSCFFPLFFYTECAAARTRTIIRKSSQPIRKKPPIQKKAAFFLYFFLDGFKVYDFEEGERSVVEGTHLLSHDSFLCSRSPSKDNGTWLLASLSTCLSLHVEKCLAAAVISLFFSLSLPSAVTPLTRTCVCVCALAEEDGNESARFLFFFHSSSPHTFSLSL